MEEEERVNQPPSPNTYPWILRRTLLCLLPHTEQVSHCTLHQCALRPTCIARIGQTLRISNPKAVVLSLPELLVPPLASPHSAIVELTGKTCYDVDDIHRFWESKPDLHGGQGQGQCQGTFEMWNLMKRVRLGKTKVVFTSLKLFS